MTKKLFALFLALCIIFISVLVVILPTFFTKNVSRVELNKVIDLNLILNDEKDIKLLFFGYSGCTDICTPRLYALSEFYAKLDKDIKKRVGIEFLDISNPVDNSLPERFSQFFNKDFKGIYLDQDVIRNYTKEFNVYFSQSLLDKTEYDHTANLYIVKRVENTKYLRYIYTSYPYDFKQINLDIKSLLNE